MDGLSLKRWCTNFQDKKLFILACLDARILRCVSPYRDALCDEPAIQVTWQDEAEWYPCCSKHYDTGEQWTGHTRSGGGLVEVIVIPDKALAWLATLPADERAKITTEEYEREP